MDGELGGVAPKALRAVTSRVQMALPRLLSRLSRQSKLSSTQAWPNVIAHYGRRLAFHVQLLTERLTLGPALVLPPLLPLPLIYAALVALLRAGGVHVLAGAGAASASAVRRSAARHPGLAAGAPEAPEAPAQRRMNTRVLIAASAPEHAVYIASERMERTEGSGGPEEGTQRGITHPEKNASYITRLTVSGEEKCPNPGIIFGQKA